MNPAPPMITLLAGLCLGIIVSSLLSFRLRKSAEAGWWSGDGFFLGLLVFAGFGLGALLGYLLG